MAVNAELWGALFEAARALKDMAPWRWADAEDLVEIVLEKNPVTVFCSVMGGGGECYGITGLLGADGYQRFLGVLEESDGVADPLYLMHEQNCLTLYWGDREEVPPDQKAIIKELGLRFRGRGNWPFFLSMKPRYVPATPDDSEAAVMTEALQNLFMCFRAMEEGRLEPQWDEDHLLLRCFSKEDQSWHNGWMELPKVPSLYPEVTLQDEVLKERLKQRPAISAEIILDLVYPDVPISGKKGERAALPLLCFMMDVTQGCVIHFEILEPGKPEIEALFDANAQMTDAVAGLYEALGRQQLSERDEGYRQSLYYNIQARNDTMSRDGYNTAALEFNRQLGRFPARLLGRLASVSPAPLAR